MNTQNPNAPAQGQLVDPVANQPQVQQVQQAPMQQMQQAPMQQMQQAPVQQAPAQTAVGVGFNTPMAGLPALPTELQQQVAEIDTGVKGAVASLARIALSGEQLQYSFNGAKQLMGPQVQAVLLGASGVVSRTYTAGVYDANNPSPPSCFSSDGKVPDMEYDGTPMVQDRATQALRKVRSCSECPLGGKGGDCDYVQNTVWAFSDLEETSLFHVPMKNTSMFHKGDLVGNDPNVNTGYLDYATKLSAINTGSGPLQSFQIETRISVWRQTTQGAAMAFGLGLNDQNQMAVLDAPRLQKAINLIHSEKYKELLESKFRPDAPAAVAAPADGVPMQQVNVQQAPVQQQVQQAPLQQAPVQQQVQQAPLQQAPVQQQVQQAPVQQAPVQQQVAPQYQQQAPVQQQVVTQAPPAGTAAQ